MSAVALPLRPAPRWRARALAAAPLLAVVAIAGGTPPATPGEHAAERPGGRVEGGTRAPLAAPAHPVLSSSGSRPRIAAHPSARTARAVRGYWTPARMSGARPAVLPLADGGARFARSGWLDTYLSRLGSGKASSQVLDPGAPWSGGGAVVRTTGKVFFSMGAGDYVCSGSAVSSPDRSTVLTAGHCVYDPDTATTATNWAFVPAYANGKAPHGVFPARRLATTSGWRTQQDFDVDVAFADVAPNAAGVALTDAVGGQPIAFNVPRGGVLHAFGYPAAPPWTGERLVHCSAGVVQDTSPEPSKDQGMACSMTPGSSGGPWLRGFSSRTGRGTLVSVTSFSYSDRPGVLWGPYLGATAKALYTAVASTPGT